MIKTCSYRTDVAELGAVLMVEEPIHFINSETGEPFEFKQGLQFIMLDDAYISNFTDKLKAKNFDISSIPYDLKNNSWLCNTALYVRDGKPLYIGAIGRTNPPAYYNNVIRDSDFIGCLDAEVVNTWLNLDIEEIKSLRNVSFLSSSNCEVFVCKDYLRYKTFEYRHDLKKVYYATTPGSRLSTYNRYQQNVVDFLLRQSKWSGPYPYVQLPKGQGYVFLFDDSKEVLDTYSNVYRTEINADDIETLKKLVGKNVLKYTEDTDLSTYTGNTIPLCNGYIQVKLKSEKDIKRSSKTKETRQITAFQSYIASVVAAIVLKRDIVLPEGGIYNSLMDGYSYSSWRGDLVSDNSRTTSSSLSDEAIEMVVNNTKDLASQYKSFTVKNPVVGGAQTPLSSVVLEQYNKLQDREGKQNIGFILGLDSNAKHSGIFGLARTATRGISLTDKTLGFGYLMSLVYFEGFRERDPRTNRYNHYESSRLVVDYKENLKHMRRSFYDSNILPNDSREEQVNELIGKERYRYEIFEKGEVVRFREIFTLSQDSLNLLEPICSNFESLTSVCEWWQNNSISLRNIVDEGIFNDSDTNKAKILFQILDLHTQTLIENLDGV